MGHSSYTNDAAEALLHTTTTRSTMDAKDYFVAPVGQATWDVLPEVDPKDKIRECRDSEAHPNSKGVIVGFDTTGSMCKAPEVFATKALPQLMGLLMQKDLCEDAAVLFAAFNDANCYGYHPLQVGQFESGLEVDDDLTRLPLQSGGGGTCEENSEILIYWAGHHTSMDCFEKRGEKGYLFILTDEMPYPVVDSRMVNKHLGGTMKQDMRTEDAVAKAQESFEVFCLIPDTGSWGGSTGDIKDRWVQLLGKDRVYDLQSFEGAAETIATLVALQEGRTQKQIQAAGIKSNLTASAPSVVSAP